MSNKLKNLKKVIQICLKIRLKMKMRKEKKQMREMTKIVVLVLYKNLKMYLEN